MPIDFLDVSPDAVLVIAGDGRIVRSNAAAVALLGATGQDDLCGRTVESFVPEGARARHIKHRSGFATEPQARSMGSGLDLVAVRLDGREVPVELILAPLEAGLVLVVLRDVGDRRRLVSALRASEAAARQAAESQRQILDALSAHLAVVDRDGRIVAVNAAWSDFARANGATAAATGVGADYLAVCRRAAEEGEVGAQGALDALSGILHGELEQHSFEYPCHHGATQRWFRSSMVSLVDGALRSAVVMHSDLTERALADIALRRSEQSLAVTLQSIGVGVVVADAEDRIVRMNSEAERLTEWTETDARGGQLGEVVPLTLTPGEQTNTPREGARMRMTLRTRSGKRRAVGVRVTLLAGSHASAGTVTVISDREDAERAQSERQSLEQRLHLADRLVSMGTLAAGVAHEINNPLSLVLMNVELALEKLRAPSLPSDAPAEITKWLEDARAGAARVRDIVGDLRAFSRVDAPREEPFDVRTPLRFAVSVAAHEIRHRAQLLQDIEEVPLVVGDPARIGQVFVNLLVNAAQAIAEGRSAENDVLLRVRSRLGRVTVEVRDTGSGIDPAHLARVFDPFFTTKAPGFGTGLGLAISHAIVREHHGDITIESTLGRGTSVVVSLPIVGAEDRASLAPVAVPSLDASQMRILVVDDEPGMGRAVQRFLKLHDVVVVSRGADAVARASAEQFDVVVCDLMMPELDGEEVYRRVCSSSPDYRQRFVFMTGGAFTERSRTFLEGHGGRTITKPFGRAELEAAIAVARRSSREPALS